MGLDYDGLGCFGGNLGGLTKGTGPRQNKSCAGGSTGVEEYYPALYCVVIWKLIYWVDS